jgi:MocE subfamily Rieske [2Fe-2S] domain protein
MSTWVKVGPLDDIEAEDVIRFDHGERTFAVYRAPDDAVFCTDGLCTHEAVHLADGLVIDHEIECPKHHATFDYRNGEALRLPACEDLKTYPAKIEDGVVWINPEQ